MFEAILLFSPHSSLFAERTLKVRYHWILQGLSAVCIHLGFAAIYFNKNNHNKPHFVSWHGKMGLCAISMATMQIIVGPSLIYYNSRILNPLGTSLALRKKMHGVAGALSFVAGYLALLLSLYSDFVIKNTSEASWYFLLVLETMLASVVVNQVSLKYVFKSSKPQV